MDQIYQQHPPQQNVNIEKITTSPDADKTLEVASQEANRIGDTYIGTGILLLALFDQQSGPAAQVLKITGLNQEQIRAELLKKREGNILTTADAESRVNVLKEFTVDLTELALKGELDPVIGREEEMHRVIQTLSRRKKNNPVLIGEAGVGKTVIVEGIAQRMAEADVPETLTNKRILSLDMAQIVAGSNMRGEFEQRLIGIRDAVIEAEGKIILFIDELHTVVGAGATPGGLDAPSLLKTALARGSLQVIGADTTDEYRKYVESDKALERRFQPILVKEPTVEETVQILEGPLPQIRTAPPAQLQQRSARGCRPPLRTLYCRSQPAGQGCRPHRRSRGAKTAEVYRHADPPAQTWKESGNTCSARNRPPLTNRTMKRQPRTRWN